VDIGWDNVYVTVTQAARANLCDHVTGPAMLGARRTAYSRHSPSDI